MFVDENRFSAGCGCLMSMFGSGSLDQMVRSTTFGLFGTTASYVPDDFVWDFPFDSVDRSQGGICAATGFRAPGHAMRRVDGVAFIAEFAPARVSK